MERVARASEQSTHRRDVGPLLDTAGVGRQAPGDKPARPATGRTSPPTVFAAAARRLVEHLGEVVRLEQLDDQSVLVDGEDATSALRH